MTENMYDRIKRLRTERGWSQDALAEKVGYQGRSTISKVEHGDRDIGQSMIQKFADAFGVKPSYLISGEDDETEKKLVIRLNDEKELKLVKLMQALSPAQKDMLIAQMQVLLSNQ